MSKYETVYRVVKNKDSNDFNNELEFTIEPYYINKDNTKIQRKGFDSWNDITAEIFDSIYWNRKSAERALVSWCEDQKISDLEAKLAESEKKIEEVKKWWSYQFNREINTYLQDKISFALEQLEKVLKILEEKQFYKKEDTAYCVHPAQIAEYIYNQIKQLKEGK